MKIATWNIKRPTKNDKRIPLILDILKTVNADILILTETNEFLSLDNDYNCFHSTNAKETFYKEGEKRVSIYSKYNSLGHIKTFRDDTSICTILETPLGDLAVYGTIIGIEGNRKPNFEEDLDQQLLDFEKIANENNLCISGDFNISFGDNYYFTENGRQKINDSFAKLDLKNLTSEISQNIDHIALTKNFITGKSITFDTWNLDKTLSDHIGVSITVA
jgi:endonuclease/exonuclease/phosphatase family metal-dependent hydrolase